jgi:hypothetical protein
MSSINYASVDHALSSAEDWVNKAGWIPVVSLVSGYCRYELGKIQTIASLAYAMIKFVESYFTGEGALKEAKLAAHYAVHGVGNMARGFVEQIFLLGNVLCLIYDMAGFRMNYPLEPGRPSYPFFENRQLVIRA